jgi:hypothetical protein
MTNTAPAAPTSEPKAAQEVADAEFNRFTEEMDLDVEVDLMDAEDLTAFLKQKRRFIAAIMDGSLVINDNGEAVYTPRKSGDIEPLTFHERTGASTMAMDGKKKGHDVAKTYAVMADLTKTHSSTFAKMKGIDIKVCEAIFNFLMD